MSELSISRPVLNPEIHLYGLTIIVIIIIVIIEGLSLLQSIPPTTANKQMQAQKKGYNSIIPNHSVDA